MGEIKFAEGVSSRDAQAVSARLADATGEVAHAVMGIPLHGGGGRRRSAPPITAGLGWLDVAPKPKGSPHVGYGL